jgi:ribosomal protein L22
MRLVTDLISGMEVNKALDVLKFSHRKLHEDLRNFSCQQFQTGRQKMKV